MTCPVPHAQARPTATPPMPSLLPFPLSLWTGEGEGEGATSVRHPGLDPEFVSEWLRATVIVPLPANARLTNPDRDEDVDLMSVIPEPCPVTPYSAHTMARPTAFDWQLRFRFFRSGASRAGVRYPFSVPLRD